MPETGIAHPPHDGFVPVAIVFSMPEAAVLVATLRAYGILALPRNQGHVSVAPTLMLALGGISVTVPPEQREDALALLESADSGWVCPPPPIVRNGPVSGFLSLLMTLFLTVPPMPRVRGLYAWRRRASAAEQPLQD